MLSETEIYGAKTNSIGTAEGTQYQYYKTSANRIKYTGNAKDKGTAEAWWMRSPGYYDGYGFCCVDKKGESGTWPADNDETGICPAICL